MATTFGKTWWGEQWLNSLNNIDYSNRLPRGANYARSGHVVKINTNGNHISAKVKGSRPRPYSVDLIMPPFFDPELGEFLREIKRRPVILSKLLNRELDPSVLALAEQFKLKVFPGQWNDLKMQCSCPDWAVPCKHLASVIYKVSAEIDNNPFLVFALHNVDLLKEMEKLGVVVHKKNFEIPAIKSLFIDKSRPDQHYDPESAYEKLNFSHLTPLHEALTSLLTPFPAFYTLSGDFKDKFRWRINKAVKAIGKISAAKIPLSQFLQKSQFSEQIIKTHTRNSLIIDDSVVVKVMVNDKSFHLNEFLYQLSLVPVSQSYDYQPSTALLQTALQLSVHLVANGAIVPRIVQLQDKTYSIRWLPSMLSKEVKKLVNRLDQMVPPEAFVWQDTKKTVPVSKDPGLNLLSVFITELVSLSVEREFGDHFADLFFNDLSYPFTQPGEEGLAGGIMAWLQKFYISQGNFQHTIKVEELWDENFKVSFSIQSLDNSNASPVTLEEILISENFNNIRFEILQSLMQLSPFVPGLDEYINSNGKAEIKMENSQFAPFLMQVIPALQLLDINILLPKALQSILKPKASVKIKKKAGGKSFLHLNELLDFEWQVAIGDRVIGEEEFRKLLNNSDGLIRFKANYIYVGKEELEKLHKHFTSTKEMTSFQMLRTALSGEYFGAAINLSDEVKDLITELNSFEEITLPSELKANLRPYQHRGFSWMFRNAKIGIGSVIADDMGLGKTLQVLAVILKFKEQGLLDEQKILVIAPSGLLTNWMAEIEKFTPSLKAVIYHGTNRSLNTLGEYDVMISSYGIMRSDAEKIKKLKWHSLIIDEAQNIKNQDTAQTKAIKSIKSNNFVAMSGTPVENRLSELWSIMDYCNRGLLGSLKEFAETYSYPIEQLNDASVADKLKKVTSPFMMRRMKTDKSIISDLPDKIEMNCFASLTKEQAGLYAKTLEECMNAIEGIEAKDHQDLFVRQGLVLQMILALKQICNHPTQFLKNKKMDASMSGKMELLFDKLDSIVDSSEKVLIFTQFTEMGGLLKHFITERYKEEPLYYHGGSSLTQRKQMVERFQSNHADKIFILSLKAAGTGLNLTAASHVIHYDLWWNPAVENQATDRAFRIGQKNNVMVHRFITKNTFEERIDEMIQNKKHLANISVATGENWIGKLSNKELREIFG
jgi:uncharacterized Zn finger protein/superfamily II DNA or RNA helicase